MPVEHRGDQGRAVASEPVRTRPPVFLGPHVPAAHDVVPRDAPVADRKWRRERRGREASHPRSSDQDRVPCCAGDPHRRPDRSARGDGPEEGDNLADEEPRADGDRVAVLPVAVAAEADAEQILAGRRARRVRLAAAETLPAPPAGVRVAPPADHRSFWMVGTDRPRRLDRHLCRSADPITRGLGPILPHPRKHP